MPSMDVPLIKPIASKRTPYRKLSSFVVAANRVC